MPDKDLIPLAEQLANLLIKKDKLLCAAESCTGGWLAKVLTDLSGSSQWFERGFVTYSNAAKTEMLGVAETIINKCGAVSQETVEAMAVGALKNSHADFSLSITGIAGPSGGTEDKPVGLVWFAWATKENTAEKIISSEQKIFNGDRDAVRQQAVVHALTELRKLLENISG